MCLGMKSKYMEWDRHQNTVPEEFLRWLRALACFVPNVYGHLKKVMKETCTGMSTNIKLWSKTSTSSLSLWPFPGPQLAGDLAGDPSFSGLHFQVSDRQGIPFHCSEIHFGARQQAWIQATPLPPTCWWPWMGGLASLSLSCFLCEVGGKVTQACKHLGSADS